MSKMLSYAQSNINTLDEDKEKIFRLEPAFSFCGEYNFTCIFGSHWINTGSLAGNP